MEIIEVINLLQNAPFLVFALILWKSERDARMKAEERERDTLLKVAGMKSPDTD